MKHSDPNFSFPCSFSNMLFCEKFLSVISALHCISFMDMSMIWTFHDKRVEPQSAEDQRLFLGSKRLIKVDIFLCHQRNFADFMQTKKDIGRESARFQNCLVQKSSHDKVVEYAESTNIRHDNITKERDLGCCILLQNKSFI